MWAVLLRITKAALRMVYIYGKLFGVFLFLNDAFLYISFFSFSFVLVTHVIFWVVYVLCFTQCIYYVYSKRRLVRADSAIMS